MALADFTNAAALGTQSGKTMASDTPLGGFIRSMIAEHKQKQEFGEKAGLLGIKSMFDTTADISKEGREQGYKIEGETRNQASPLYKAQTDAYNELAKQRVRADTDQITAKDAADIIADPRKAMMLKVRDPLLFQALTEKAQSGIGIFPGTGGSGTGGGGTVAFPGVTQPTQGKEYFYKKYNLK